MRAFRAQSTRYITIQVTYKLHCALDSSIQHLCLCPYANMILDCLAELSNTMRGNRISEGWVGTLVSLVVKVKVEG